MGVIIWWSGLVMAVKGMGALSGRGSGSQNASLRTCWPGHSFVGSCSQDHREGQSSRCPSTGGTSKFRSRRGKRPLIDRFVRREKLELRPNKKHLQSQSAKTYLNDYVTPLHLRILFSLSRDTNIKSAQSVKEGVIMRTIQKQC